MKGNKAQEYWSLRYKKGQTGWDIGYPSTPLRNYIDQLTDKRIFILVPGAGNGYEVEYLFHQGFNNVFMLDISKFPLETFKDRNPDFPTNQLINTEFFDHQGQYDLIIEQTFFCSLTPTPENRMAYAEHMSQLLKPTGKLVGLWFDFPMTADFEKPPFGGNRDVYLQYLLPYFKIRTFEKCYNSIPPRKGNELFGVFEKK
ncbi:MAG: TPMT family class I SAM-dependent methyltransferase [Maribacter sp.]|nr:TPMT family class I SAM-dependent methyltransferase [Maribacter sp.]